MLNEREKFEIYIPTYKRPDDVKTLKYFKDAIVVCPESQLEDYKKYNPNAKFMPCPDSVEGNMAKKRNWIKENAKTNWFVMCDDDLICFKMYEGGKVRKVPAEDMLEVIYNLFVMCEDLGTVMFGLNLQTARMFYCELSPFSTLSVVLGPFSGHIKSDLKYDERFPTKEDFDYALQVLHKYHKILRFNKYCYDVGHLKGQKGGSHSLRTMKLEENQNVLLTKKWGKNIISYDMNKDIDPVVRIPLKGI